MNSERKKDTIISIIMLGISLLFYLNTKTLTPPADIFPKVVIFLFAILGFILLVKALFIKKLYTKQEGDNEETPEKEVNVKRKWISIASLILYVLLMPILGFYFTSMIFLILISWYLIGNLELKGVTFPVLVSGVVVGILYVTFSVFLKIPVPSGLLF